MCHKFGCVFYSPTTMTCDFFLITGRVRGCPPTDDCDKYRLTLGDIKPVKKGFKPRRITQKKLDEMEAIYQKYKDKVTCVEEFSRETGVNRQMAHGYIRKVHPESKLLINDRWAYP